MGFLSFLDQTTGQRAHKGVKTRGPTKATWAEVPSLTWCWPEPRLLPCLADSLFTLFPEHWQEPTRLLRSVREAGRGEKEALEQMSELEKPRVLPGLPLVQCYQVAFVSMSGTKRLSSEEAGSPLAPQDDIIVLHRFTEECKGKSNSGLLF